MLLLRAELRKCARPVVAGLLVLSALAAVVTATYGQEFAHAQSEATTLSVGYDEMLSCDDIGERPGRRCYELLARDRRSEAEENKRFVAETNRQASAAHASQQPLGALGFTAGLFGSLFGLLLAFAIAAVHVGGEWRRGTAPLMFATEPRWGRVLAAKVATTWLGCTLALGVAWLAAVLFGQLSQSIWPLGVPPDAHASLGFALERAVAASGILLVFSLVAVVVAAWLRAPLPTLLTGIAIAAVLNALTPLEVLGAWTPGAVVSDLMQFAGTPVGYFDHIWALPDPADAAPLAIRVLAAGALLVAGLAYAQRALAPRDRIA